MKLVFALTFLFSTLSAYASSCCFCIADPKDEKATKAECKKWLREASRNLNCSHSDLFLSSDELKYPENLSCEQVHFYGAFHGLSRFYSEPFKIVTSVAKLPTVKKITYDGSTCLVFNNTDQVKTEAAYLARAFPDKDISIKGNQNIGVVRSFSVLAKPTERAVSSSKMNIEISSGQFKTSYDACSAPEKRCGYSQPYSDATTDPNSKFCMLNDELVVQKCCPYKNQEFGNWGAPEQECR